MVTPCLRRAALVFVLVCGVTGCGGTTYPVEGRVVFKEDGQPLRGGIIELEPVDSAIQVNPRGGIDENGYFKLAAFKPGDGAPEGMYRVLIIPAVLPGQNPESWPTPRSNPTIDARFQSYDTSGLTVQVRRGNNELNIEVERPTKGKRK